MASDKGRMYEELYKCFKNAYPNKKGHVIQAEANKYWATVKDAANTADLVKQKIIQLENLRRTSQAGLMTFWAKVSKESSSSTNDTQQSSSSLCSSTNLEQVDGATRPTDLLPETEVHNKPDNAQSLKSASVISESVHPPSTPAQDHIQKEITAVQSEITALVCRHNINALSPDDMKRKQKLESDLKKKIAMLKLKRNAQNRQQKFRHLKKAKLAELCETNPELKQQLNIRKTPGRPPIDEEQPELLKAIVDIATYGSAAGERRRTDSIRTVKTLDELTSALNSKGIPLPNTEQLDANRIPTVSAEWRMSNPWRDTEDEH